MTADLVADGVLTPLTLTEPAEGDLRPIQIIPDGATTSTKGTIRLDASAARELVATFNADPDDLLVDYDHQSEGGEHAAPDGKAPAAGWVKKLWYEAGRGLMGLVQWTERARDMIRAGEYRHLSPSMLVQKSDGLVAVLKSIALTNTPAIKGLEPLTASARGSNDMEVMNMADNEAQTLLQELTKALSLEGTPSAVEVLKAALAALSKQGDTDTEGETEPSTNTAGDAVSPGLRKVLMERDEAVKALRDRDVDILLEPWLAKAYINPNDKRDVAFCRQLAADDPEMFEHQMSLRKEYVPQGRTTPPPAGSTGSASRRAVITGALRKVADSPELEKLSKREDLVNLALREAALPKLEEGELKAFL